jgi:SAM-dependent methyltransferase
MLASLQAKAGGSIPFPIVQGDLTELRFRPAAFGAALAANVFHLLAAWRTTVAELVRVVRPGGLVFVNLGTGGPAEGRGAFAAAKFREVLGGAWPRGEGEIGPRDAPNSSDASSRAASRHGLPWSSSSSKLAHSRQ